MVFELILSIIIFSVLLFVVAIVCAGEKSATPGGAG